SLRRAPRPRVKAVFMLLAVVVVTLADSETGSAQAQGAWFGLTTPPGLGDPHRAPVPVDAAVAGLAPAVVPAGEEVNTALRGDAMLQDLATIVEFSKESRSAGDQMWGRITGRPAAAKAVEWAAQRFREIGLSDVEVQ